MSIYPKMSQPGDATKIGKQKDAAGWLYTKMMYDLWHYCRAYLQAIKEFMCAYARVVDE